MQKSKANGAILGIAFGLVGMLAVKGLQGSVGSENFANTFYGWFTTLAQKIIESVPQLSSLGETTIVFTIAGLIGLLIGLYVEVK